MANKPILVQGGDGTAIPSNMVGGVISASITETALVSGAVTNVSSLSLPPGVWMIVGKCMLAPAGGIPSAWTDFFASISDVSATLDLPSTTRELSTGTANTRYLAASPRYYNNNTGANKTVYFVVASTFTTAGTVSPSNAASAFYAMRIA
jgi:hypothetical protein